jgi:hypothetical protein
VEPNLKVQKEEILVQQVVVMTDVAVAAVVVMTDVVVAEETAEDNNF